MGLKPTDAYLHEHTGIVIGVLRTIPRDDLRVMTAAQRFHYLDAVMEELRGKVAQVILKDT